MHACPLCSVTIRAGRALEIETAMACHLAAGGGALFVTLTLPHDEGDDLAPMWDAIALAFKRVAGGKAWMGARAEFGLIGSIRAVEVTYGEHGWHPHFHVLVLSAAPLDDDQAVDLVAGMRRRWCSSVVSSGYRPPSFAHGVHWSRVVSAKDVADYTAKVFDEVGRGRALGSELTRHDLKVGRRKGRNPFAILADFLATGDAGDLDLWHEYEAASLGRRSLTWSPGLKAALGVAEVSDETLAEGEETGDVVLALDGPTWAALVRRPGAVCGLLEAVEGGGPGGGQAAGVSYLLGLGLDPPPQALAA